MGSYKRNHLTCRFPFLSFRLFVTFAWPACIQQLVRWHGSSPSFCRGTLNAGFGWGRFWYNGLPWEFDLLLLIRFNLFLFDIGWWYTIGKTRKIRTSHLTGLQFLQFDLYHYWFSSSRLGKEHLPSLAPLTGPWGFVGFHGVIERLFGKEMASALRHPRYS